VDTELKQAAAHVTLNSGGGIMRDIPVLTELMLASALACTLFALPAQAVQRDRVFVASYGSDTNPCTFGSPCKTFQHAHDTVAAGGEITAIDSAGFGPVTITKAVTITSPNGVEAGIAAAAGDNAVTVNAQLSDTVVLSGLTLEGAGSGQIGIAFNSGAELEIVNCSVRNYTLHGIVVGPGASMSLLISNTIVSDNGNTGINLGTAGTGSGHVLTAALDRVTVNNNAYGVVSDPNTGPVEVSIANSHIDNNSSYGILTLDGSSSATSNLVLKEVTLNETNTAIAVTKYTTVWLSGVTQGFVAGLGLTGTAISFGVGPGNTAYSDGTNHLMGGLGGGATLQAWPAN
jgi:hypothetical protein